MSRTYRKNLRIFDHYKGEYYCPLSNYPSLKVKDKENIKDTNILWSYYPHNNEAINPECTTARFYREVLVGDGDTWGHGIGGKNKTRLHKMDRSRYRQALNKDYDNPLAIKPAFDRWDWE
jgi:hypothetical protein